MRVHHPARRPGRAGGVDDGGRRIRPDVARDSLDASGVPDVLEGQHAPVPAGQVARGAEVPCVGQDHVDPCVVDDPLLARPRQGAIGHDEDASGLERAQHRHDRVRVESRENGDGAASRSGSVRSGRAAPVPPEDRIGDAPGLRAELMVGQ